MCCKFCHPDITRILTSLSHHCRGLNNEDLFLTFSYLLRFYRYNMSVSSNISSIGFSDTRDSVDYGYAMMVDSASASLTTHPSLK